jgi:hypothetical protein
MTTPTTSAIRSAITWRCSQCPESFNTKGKRDAHNKGVHSLVISVQYIDGTKDTVSRVDGEFACRCGNKYKHSGSLVRHAKECKKQVPLSTPLPSKLVDEEGFDHELEIIGIPTIYVCLKLILDGQRISRFGITNASQNSYEEMIRYVPEYEIAVCIPCGHSVNASPGVKNHLITKHSCPNAIAKSIDESFKEKPIRSQSDPKVEWITPLPTDPAIPHLAIYRNAIGCHLCNFVCLSLATIKNHYRDKHREERENQSRKSPKVWRKNVSVQRFSEGGYGKGFFEVERRIASTTPDAVSIQFIGSGSTRIDTMTTSSNIKNQIRQRLHAQIREQTTTTQAALQIIVPSNLVTEVNPWLERTKWITHLNGQNLKLMFKFVGPLVPDERELGLICEAFKYAIVYVMDEVARGKLNQFDLQQINSFKRHQSYSKPFNTNIARTTVNRYILIWQRILCYIFRIQKRVNNGEGYLALYKLNQHQVLCCSCY